MPRPPEAVDFLPVILERWAPSNSLDYLKSAKEIVAEAWHLTIEHRSRLFRLGIVPSFFSILVTGWYIFFQIESFRHSPLFSQTPDNGYLFDYGMRAWQFFSQSSALFALSLFLLLIIFVGWFFAPMLCRAAVTDLITKAWRGQPLEKGCSRALLHFFPIFETTALKKAMDPQTFISEFALIIRNLPGAVGLLTPLLLFFMAIGMLCLFFFSLTTQAIMIREEKFLGAITTSFRLVIENFTHTLKILVLFLLVEMRVLINILVVFLLPMTVIGTTGVFAAVISPLTGYLLAALIMLVLLLLASYLTGILFVFSEAIWTVAFLEFSGENRVVRLQTTASAEQFESAVPAQHSFLTA